MRGPGQPDRANNTSQRQVTILKVSRTNCRIGYSWQSDQYRYTQGQRPPRRNLKFWMLFNSTSSPQSAMKVGRGIQPTLESISAFLRDLKRSYIGCVAIFAVVGHAFRHPVSGSFRAEEKPRLALGPRLFSFTADFLPRETVTRFDLSWSGQLWS